MLKLIIKLLPSLFCSIILFNIAQAALPSELGSTSEITTFETIPAWLVLTEVNFKNSTADYLKFKVLAKNSASTVNLKGLEFYDDKIFKTIERDYLIPNNSEIILIFNQTQADSIANKQLFTTHTGLTSTTEQIILKQANIYFDFFCWQKAPITATEKQDWQKLYQANFWDTEGPEGCFESNLVTKNQSLFRINQNHNKEAWKAGNSATTSLTNAPSTSKTTPTGSLPNLPNLFTDPKAISTITPNNSVTKAKTTTINLPSNQAPLINNPLEITEILPAPQNGKEWIEIHNQSSSKIDLTNWHLDDADGGSKPFRLSQIMGPQSYLLLDSSQTKLNLNNTGDQVRLFNKSKQLIDQISYSEPPKNESYAKIMIDSEPQWLWTKEITPELANPIYSTISGTISENPNFSGPKYYFLLTDPQNQLITVYFEEELIKAPLAKTIFSSGTKGQFTGVFDRTNPATLQLKKYQLDNTVETSKTDYLTPLILLIIGSTTGLYFYYKKPPILPDSA